MDHFPTVGHLTCTVKAVYIKSFGDQKMGLEAKNGVRVNPIFWPPKDLYTALTVHFKPTGLNIRICT